VSDLMPLSSAAFSHVESAASAQSVPMKRRRSLACVHCGVRKRGRSVATSRRLYIVSRAIGKCTTRGCISILVIDGLKYMGVK
jgi:hypothetical protein